MRACICAFKKDGLKLDCNISKYSIWWGIVSSEEYCRGEKEHKDGLLLKVIYHTFNFCSQSLPRTSPALTNASKMISNKSQESQRSQVEYYLNSINYWSNIEAKKKGYDKHVKVCPCHQFLQQECTQHMLLPMCLSCIPEKMKYLTPKTIYITK